MRFAVIGAGLAGSATAWQLARRGYDVTLLEQSAPANAAGSSHGSARIFRYAYPDPFYAQLVKRARRSWDELESEAGVELIRNTGAVDFGELREPAQLAGVLSDLDVAHELLSLRAAAERWPQMAFDTEVLWHPGAGVIDAESAVRTMVELATAHGAQVNCGWPVAEVAPDGNVFRLTSSTGAEVGATDIVLAVGGWLPSLLPSLPAASTVLRRMPALQVREEQTYHFAYREATESAAGWPSFIHKRQGMQVYGLPGGRDAGFAGQKVAEYNGGTIIDSARAASGQVSPANRDRIIDYVANYLPGLIPEPYAESTCLFTNTPDEDFVIDRADHITVLSPCSGHGAKFAPLIGHLAAEVATGSKPLPRFALGAR